METTRKRRWWQFGIRDCLWLMLVVGLAGGWLLHQLRLNTEIEDLRDALNERASEARRYRSMMEYEGWIFADNGTVWIPADQEDAERFRAGTRRP